MCLNTLIKFRVRPTHTDGSIQGWKAVISRDNYLISEFKHYEFKKGWNKASTDLLCIHTNTGEAYRAGFHIFTSKEDAIYWISGGISGAIYANYYRIIPVYYTPKNILAKGVQKNCNVVVASRIWIEPHDYDAAVKNESIVFE